MDDRDQVAVRWSVKPKPTEEEAVAIVAAMTAGGGPAPTNEVMPVVSRWAIEGHRRGMQGVNGGPGRGRRRVGMPDAR